METAHIKIFTNSYIIVKGLQNRLEENEIKTLIKDRHESARLTGLVQLPNSTELFVLNTDKEKAEPIVAAYEKEINS